MTIRQDRIYIQRELIVIILLVFLCVPAFGQMTAKDWFDQGNALTLQGNSSGAMKDVMNARERDKIH